MATPIESLEGLKRKLTISIPDDNIEAKMQPRLKEIAQQATLKGFRPGKVPMKEIQRRFGQQVRLEIIESLAQEGFNNAVQEHDLKLAGAPQFEPINLEAGNPVSFAATFEVQPEVELQPLKGAKIDRYEVSVSEKDLDKMVDNMRKQHAEWNDVDRAAQEGDRIVIDFDGAVDGEPLEGGQADNYELELGSGNMIEGFESGLIGVKAGDETELTLSFPKDYHHADVAGKPVVFKIKVHKVREGILPELDEHFAKKLKIKGGIEKLRDEVRDNIQTEANTRSKQRLKQALCDVLLEKHTIDVPIAMVDYEIDQMKKNMASRMGLSEEQAHELEAPVDFEKQARDNVTLGLLFAAVIEQNSMELSDEELEAKLDEMAKPFSDPASIKRLYQSNERMLEDVKAQAMEDKVVNLLLEQVELTDKPVDFEEFDKLLQKGA